MNWLRWCGLWHIRNGILLSHKTQQNNAICNKVDGIRDSHTEWSKSERKTNTIWYHFYLESHVWHKWTSPQKRKKPVHMENRLMVAKGVGEGVAWTGSLGLIGANYCHWNWYAMRYCYIAQGTISSHLWWNMMEDNVRKRMSVCVCVIYNWVTCCIA